MSTGDMAVMQEGKKTDHRHQDEGTNPGGVMRHE